MQTVTGRDTAEIWGGEKGKRHQTAGSTAFSLGSRSVNMASIASLSGGSAGFSMTLLLLEMRDPVEHTLVPCKRGYLAFGGCSVSISLYTDSYAD